METFSALLTLCEGNPPVIGGFPHQGQWRGALMFPLICAWTNGWTNNRDAGDLRRYRTHYDVTLMVKSAVKQGFRFKLINSKRIERKVPFWTIWLYFGHALLVFFTFLQNFTQWNWTIFVHDLQIKWYQINRFLHISSNNFVNQTHLTCFAHILKYVQKK